MRQTSDQRAAAMHAEKRLLGAYALNIAFEPPRQKVWSMHFNGEMLMYERGAGWTFKGREYRGGFAQLVDWMKMADDTPASVDRTALALAVLNAVEDGHIVSAGEPATLMLNGVSEIRHADMIRDYGDDE